MNIKQKNCRAAASAAVFILLGVFASSLSAQTPTPHPINLTDTSVYKAGTNLPAVLRAIDDGHGAYVPAFILVDTNGDPVSLGGGGGGDATAANQTTEIARLTSILAKLTADPATQATLAAILAKLIAAPATEGEQAIGNGSLAAILAKIIAAPATEAKQDAANTSLANVDTNLGARADSAATTDTGTFSLIALFKRALQTLTTIATNTAAALPSGTNLIGKVGIDQTTPGTTNAVAVTGAQYTIAISSVTSNGTVAAGKHHIEFILSTDFAGTIGGVTIDPAALAVYSPGDAPVGSTFAALSYTISAGNAVLTTW